MVHDGRLHLNTTFEALNGLLKRPDRSKPRNIFDHIAQPFDFAQDRLIRGYRTPRHSSESLREELRRLQRVLDRLEFFAETSHRLATGSLDTAEAPGNELRFSACVRDEFEASLEPALA